MADDKVIVKIDGDDSGFKKSLSGIGSTAQKALGIVAKGIAATTTAVGGLAVAAVKGYADCEQLVGGIETLFGAKGAKSVEEYAKSVGKSVSKVKNEYAGLVKSQQNVLNNANNAYKTAGLSANAYMETVTSFAASLKQSFADTPEGIMAAGEAANQAVIDMADNANKMGTSMEAIQTAYQGFAKQNYTMLDNLKLGYGGTKTEMERLLADAQKLSGVKYDISNLADVYEAIHVIQTEIGITGTTAKEAKETITGSVNMMKASWSNLVVGIADENADLDKLIDNFIDSLLTVGDNILPVFETALEGIGEFVTQAADKIIPKMVDVIIGALPSLANAATQIIIALTGAIISNLPVIIDAAKQIVIAIAQALGDAVPVIKPITDIIVVLAQNIESIIPVISGAVIAFGTYKAIVAATTVVQTALNVAMTATPWGLIITLVGAAAGMVAGYATATREQTEEEKKSASAIKERAGALESLQESCYKAASAVETEAATSRNLVDELKSIVDENGKIKEGYEARAQVITGELNSALGTEISIINGVIQKYQEEMSAIDQLVEKKRAAAIVEAERPQYTEAVSEYNNALKQQAEITAQIAEQQAIIDDENSSDIAAQEAFGAIDELKAQLETNQTLIDGYTQTITAYEQNMEALATGAYDTIRSINDATAKEIANASTLTEAEAAVQTAINTYTVGLESCKRQGTEMTASMKTSIANNIKDAIAKVAELGGEIPEGISLAIENGKPVVVNSVDELLAILEAGLTPGGSIATTKGTEATTNYAAALALGKGPIETSVKGVVEAGWVAAGNVNAPATAAQTLTEKFSIGLKGGTSQFKTSGEEAATEYSAGIEEKTSEAENSGKALAESSLNGTKSEQDKASGGAQSLGKDFSSGYAKGIAEGKNEAVNAAVDLAKAALQAVQDTQNSDSPAKETESFGRDFDDGYELGISENSDGAIKAAEDLAEGTVSMLGESAFDKAYEAGNSYSSGFAAGLAQATDDIRKHYSELHDATLGDLGYTYDEARKRINQLTYAMATVKDYRDSAMRKLDIATYDAQIQALTKEVDEYNTSIANMDYEREVLFSAMAKAEVESGMNVADNATGTSSESKNKFKKEAENAIKIYEYAEKEADLLYDIWEANQGKVATATEKRAKSVEKLTSKIAAQEKIVAVYQSAYEEAIGVLGETSEETLSLKNSTLEAQKTLAETRSELISITDVLTLLKDETDQNINLIEAKYELWCSVTKETASEEEKAAQKTEYLSAKLFEQGRYVAELEKRYAEAVEKYGATSAASRELELQLCKEKDAWVDINNELKEHNDSLKLTPEEINSAIYAYNDYLKKYYDIMKSYGMKDEEIYKLAAEATGYDKVLNQTQKVNDEVEKASLQTASKICQMTLDGIKMAVGSDSFSSIVSDETEKAGEISAETFVNSFVAEMGTVPDSFFDYGEKSAESFENGFMSKFKETMNVIKTRIQEEINIIISGAAQREAGNILNTTQINNNETYIIQPSSGESTQAQLSAIEENKLVNNILRN